MTKRFKLMRKSVLNGVELEMDSFDTYEEAAEALLDMMDDWVANMDTHFDAHLSTTERVVASFKRQHYIDGPINSMMGVEWFPEEHKAQLELAMRYEDAVAVNS